MLAVQCRDITEADALPNSLYQENKLEAAQPLYGVVAKTYRLKLKQKTGARYGNVMPMLVERLIKASSWPRQLLLCFK
jgi:hypothetical protein